MAMRPFGALFPQLGKDECRVVVVQEDIEYIPPDRYALFDYYCDESRCDCRRVILNVLRESSGQSVGMISLGLYPDVLPAEPFLDPFHPRAKFAGRVLQMIDALVLSDVNYVARLRRHYHMFRAEITGRPSGMIALSADQVAKRIAERKQRHKTLRRAQQRRRGR